MNKKLLVAAIAFYVLAVIAAGSAVYFANDTVSTYGDYTGVDSASEGGAAGMSIIAAALIVCGTFFLYKHFTNNYNR